MEFNKDKYYDKGLTGLANVGNSCYINSCMQLLSHTYELNELLTNLDKNKINDNIDATVLIEWNNLREMIWNENCTIAPWGFIKTIQSVAKKKGIELFMGYSQNDVTEFLLFIIECLHTSLKRDVDMSIKGNAINNLDLLAKDCYTMMENMYKNEYSELLNIFYGISITQIKSFETDEVLSRKCEPFSILTLSLPENNKTTSIFECLDNYSKNEELKDDNAWFNEKTNEKEDVNKNIIFWNLPNVLIIELKRFDNSNKKIRSLVNTELEDVDFSKYVSGYNANEYIYDLFGVANHMGNVFGGHYTANIKNLNGKWYNFNDTNISIITKNKVITEFTYCLFYRKKNKN